VSPRPYSSSLRDEHARLTRRRIVEAAAELFVAQGYAAATIDAIAARAGVSRKTVFTSVGGKAALLTLAFDHALAGDDEPVAIAERPAVRRMMGQDDPAALLAAWVAMNAAIAGRVASLHLVLLVAADGDADAAALLGDLDRQRAEGNQHLVERLARLGGLRPGLDLDEAAAIADLLIDPSLYRRLVVTHRWPPERYTAYLQHVAAASLLDDTGD
jgi:AcrR family transcriptional regulator